MAIVALNLKQPFSRSFAPLALSYLSIYLILSSFLIRTFLDLLSISFSVDCIRLITQHLRFTAFSDDLTNLLGAIAILCQ